ncbi:uncharacterized protein LOC131682912 [Topomyia yanbarensis]|uniref:uncharacterized protein LOC131682912 n=1 Tax=Topomyia yanbarensis TaxID=2498891 RepID=UPI00273C850A|nr:uncharacterized protein LOC131682912 [Topomyia yanbarensis]
MSRWLMVVCILGVFSSTVHGTYPALTIAGNIVQSLSNGLKTVSTALGNYNTAVVKAHDSILNAAKNLVANINGTYLSLNKTYAASYNTQLQSAFASLSTINNSITSFDSQMSSYINQQIQAMSNQYKSYLSNLLTYTYSLPSGYMSAKGEACLLANASQLQAANVSLERYATCLVNQTAYVATLTPIAVNFLSYGQVNYNLLAKQIAICSTAGPNYCYLTFMNSLIGEVYTMTSEMSLTTAFLNSVSNVVINWTTLCGQFITTDINETLARIQSALNNCQSV